MQSVSSRTWTRVAVFISYDDNNYTKGTSCPGYGTKQSDGDVPVMLELRGMYPLLPLLPGPLWPEAVDPDKGPISGLNRSKPCFFRDTDFCI